MAGVVEAVKCVREIVTVNGDASRAEIFIGNIRKYFEEELTSNEIDGAFVCIFDTRSGLLTNVNNLLTRKKFKNVLVVLLDLLRYLVHHHQERSSPYIRLIKDASVRCVSYELTASEKERACLLLSEILQSNSQAQDLDVASIIETLFIQIDKHKPQPKVLEHFYRILGIISRWHPELMTGYSDKLKKYYIYDLQKQFQKRNSGSLTPSIVTGCFDGLSEYMYSFQFLEDDSHMKKEMYNFIKFFSNYDSDRKTVQRAAINFLQLHGEVLRDHLFCEYKLWHSYFLQWMKDSNALNRDVATKALKTFYKAIACCIEEQGDVGSSKDALVYFIAYFKHKLQDDKTDKHERDLVIRGLGVFSGVCVTLIEHQEMMYIFTLIIQRAQHLCSNISLNEMDEKAQYKLQMLPTCVESLANIIIHMKSVGSDHLVSLQYISVVLMQQFGFTPPQFQRPVIDSLMLIIYSLSTTQGMIFDDFLEIVVYQGVIRVCMTENIEREKFIPLWNSLMKIKDYKIEGMPQALKQGIVNKVYDSFIKTLMQLIQKLDLRISENVDDKTEDLHSSLQPTNIKDLKIFINLVDFFIGTLPNCDPLLFTKWAQPFLCCVLKETSKNRLVNSFYQLLAECLQLAEKINFFDKTQIANLEQNKLTYDLICKFLQRMLMQVKYVKGDLQIACIRVFLVAPLSVIPTIVYHAVEAFQVAFRVGHSYLKLAHEGLVTLQKWKDYLPPEDMRPILVAVLPELEFFLQSRGGEVFVDKELENLERRRRSNRFSLTRRKLVEIPDSELVQLQRRILLFLGPLESDVALAILNCEQASSWGHTKKLKFKLPFKNMNVSIYLDLVLPRVVDLALCCSDRQTRITACELLHAIIMFMLGTSKQLMGVDETEMSELFQKIFLPLLQLSSDPDDIIFNLFSPLVLQLAHWYSSAFQVKSKNTDLFINALLDGITHATDSPLRESSAKCLHEFVEWAIKQNPAADLGRSSVNIKYFIKRICMLCVHPSSAKRLGGALAFNATYRRLREDDSVTEEHWFELLYYFVRNLSLSDLQVPTGITSESEKAVEHVARVLRERSQFYNKLHKKRRIPEEFKGGLLFDTVVWLFHQCGSTQVDCRRKCIELVCSLAPLISNCKSVEEFVKRFASEECGVWCVECMQNVVEIVECRREKTVILIEPTLDKSVFVKTPTYIIHWLHSLTASLDCYIWLLKESTDFAVLLKHASSRIINLIGYYVENVSDGKTSSLDKMVEDILSLQEHDLYIQSRCILVIRLFEFVTTVFSCAGENVFQYISEAFFSSSFWNLLAKCVFEPYAFGFEMSNGEMNDKLFQTLKQFLRCLKSNTVLLDTVKNMNSVIHDYVQNYINTMAQLRRILVTSEISRDHRAAVQGVIMLVKTGFLAERSEDIAQLQGHILQQVFRALTEDTEEQAVPVAVELQPLAHSYGEAILQFALMKSEQVNFVISCILNPTELRKPFSKTVIEHGKHGSIEHGEHFICTFGKVVSSFLFEYPNETMERLTREIESEASQRAVKGLHSLIQSALKNKTDIQRPLQEIFLNILEYWPALQAWSDACLDNKRHMLVMLMQITECATPRVGCLASHAAGQWVLNLLTDKDIALEHKHKALDLLPCLTASSEGDQEKFRNALKEFSSHHIPRYSSELRPGTLEYDNVVLAFEKILKGLQESGCPILLQRVIAMTVQDDKHVCEKQIQEALPVLISRLTPQKQHSTFQVACNIFVNSKEYDPATRKNCINYFLLPLLNACSVTAVRQFFENSVRQLLNMLEVPLKTSRNVQTEHNLVSRIGCWKLFEILFQKIPADELKSNSCSIAKAAFDGDMTIVKSLSSKVLSSRIETLPSTAESQHIVELFRQMQCATYSTSAIIICNTQDDMKFYNRFLFYEDKKKNEVLWKNIIDCSKSYVFPVDFDQIPKMRKHWVNIRPKGQDQIHYISTETNILVNSTLNEDVTRFDYIVSTIQDASHHSAFRNENNSSEIVLEGDELNQHECMAVLCGVLENMAKQRLYTIPQPGDKPETLPPWMKSLHDCFRDDKRHRNIRLFIMKLILNKSELFKPFAAHWLYPIMQAIVDEVFGNELNYMLMDVISLLVSWSDTGIPSANEGERMRASQVLQVLMMNALHSRRDIFKYNLEVIRTIVQVWKGCINVPHQVLLDQLSVAANQELAIHLAGILLANGIPPWSSTGKRSYFSELTSLVVATNKLLCQTSELIGMCFKELDPHMHGNFLEEDETIVSTIKGKVLNLDRTPDKFLLCLNSMQKYYAPIADSFLDNVLYHLPKVNGKFKVLCLEIILSRLELLQERVHCELDQRGFTNMLHHAETDLQYVSLRVVKKMLPLIRKEDAELLLKEVLKLSSVKNANCRFVIYEIFMSAYECEVLADAATGKLLEGFVDNDPVMQEIVFKFWNEKARLPTEMPDRFLHLISSLYSPIAEKHFLNYSLSLLLDPVTFSSEFSTNIFDHPLSECEFKELKVWERFRQQNSSFAMISYSMGGTYSSRLQSYTHAPNVVITQKPLAFQPTISDTAPVETTFNVPDSTVSSSFLISTQPGTSQMFKPQGRFGERNFKVPSGTPAFRGRRFWSDKRQTSNMHARREVMRTAKRQELQQVRKENREKHISMYRQYRTGDFPDIQISYSSLLEPMQKLAKYDVVIGRQVLVLIFSGIVEALPGDKLVPFAAGVSSAFSEIVQRTRGTNTMMLSSLLEMSLECSQHVNVDINAVSGVCRESGLLMLGSLLLEEKLIALTNERRAVSDAVKNNNWLRLAELYQDMDEWDVVYGIFHEKLNCHTSAKCALEAEAKEKWKEAENLYRDAIENSNDSDNQKDYYYECYFKCLAHLADWGKLNKYVDKQLEATGWNSIWDDDWIKSALLPKLFSSEIQLLGTKDPQEVKFLEKLHLWLGDNEKSEFIENNMTEELALFCIWEDNLGKAQAYTDKCYTEFLKNWIHMSTLAFKQRSTALRDVHRLAELQIFLNFTSSLPSSEKLSELVRNWKKNIPVPPCSLLDWDRRLTYRSLFASKVGKKGNEFAAQWPQIDIELRLCMVDTALEQSNFHVARKYLGTVKEKWAVTLPPHRLRWTINDSKCKWLSSLSASPEEVKLIQMIEACNVFESCDPMNAQVWQDHPQMQEVACQHMSTLAASLWNLLKASPHVLSSLDRGETRKLLQWVGRDDLRVGSMLEALHDIGLTSLHCAVNVALKAEEKAATVAKAYYKIAEYYESMHGSQKNDLHYMRAVLKAMKYGSCDSKYLFPRLLQQSTLEANWMEIFVNESHEVPEWMFLLWVNQILACLDKPIGQVLHVTVERIARAYPQAMMWAYRLSREKYDPESVPSDVLKRLDELLLHKTLMKEFLKAVSCLVQPEKVLEHRIMNIIKMAEESNCSQMEIQGAFQSLTDSLFKLDDSIHGKCFHDLQKYSNRVQQAQAEFCHNKNQSLDLLKVIVREVRSISKRHGRVPLDYYSPWLSKFQLSPWGDYLELPGQYTGEQCPLPQYHVRIAGFVQQVRVIESQRWPIKLTIIGNNAKEYPFLVKYGEDLRQDQRIQQLFNLMNIIFHKDSACLHRQLNLVTYQVVPLSCDLGIIQWVDGTKTLRSFMEKIFSNEEKENYKKARLQQYSWLKATRPDAKEDVWHRKAYHQYSRSDTIKAFRERVNLIPWDIFRRAFIHISASGEEYFARRHKFVCSYAAMCISHWLLGIGDRHLGNCLVRESDGCAIGIDFGYAFGCATQFLPVPELIPFRMTPHIVYLMKPFKQSGLLQRTMVHSLHALRDSCQMLLAAMEVFVHEPSINWIELAQKERGASTDKDALERWLPQEKIDQARRKFDGENPIVITEEELRSGHSKYKYMNSYLEVLAGEKRHNKRANAPHKNLEVHEQVDCLLDLAMDPHVLGKTWIGWEAWI